MANNWHQEAGCTLWRIVFIVTRQPEAKQPAISARHGQLLTPGGRMHSITDSIYSFKTTRSKATISVRHGQLLTPGGRVHTITDSPVDSRYLELQGTPWNTSRYPYFDIPVLRNWGKQLIEQPTLTKWICNLTPKLEIYWKYCCQYFLPVGSSLC